MKRTTLRLGIGVGAVVAVAAALLTVVAVSSPSWVMIGRSVEAQEPVEVTLRHVNPDGSDFLGNPFCPQTVWSSDGKARVVSVVDWQDCNNAVGQVHLIRTEGWSPATMSVGNWNLQNGSGANAAVVAQARCGDLAEVAGRTNWDPANDDEQCVAVGSTTPGETLVTLTYNDGGVLGVTNTLVKEWDKYIDTVILKAADVESVALPSPFPSGTKVLLPKDADGDGDRDAADEHLMNHDGETQEHAVIFDEALKVTRSGDGPIQLIDVVHGQHADFPDHPSEGAVVLAFIDSPRAGGPCTFFTNATGDIDGDGGRDAADSYGTAVVGITDWRGFSIGPKLWPVGAQFTAEALAEASAHGLAAGMSNNNNFNTGSTADTTRTGSLLGVYVDTRCEEQATITFKVGYPNFVQSVPEIPAPEWETINWTTVEAAKQPQIRWAGEEIVLEKRWAPSSDWFPNGDANGDTVITDPEDVCPLVSLYDADVDGDVDWDDLMALGLVQGDDTTIIDHYVHFSRLGGPGDLIGGYVDSDDDGYLDSADAGGLPPDEAVGDIDKQCHSKALYSSEDPGEADVEVSFIRGSDTCATGWIPDPPNPGGYRGYSCAGDSSYSEQLINKYAFLVWYLKIYQVKLTNVDGARPQHNAGGWSPEPIDPGTDSETDTLNVSADALLRVRVKGWFRTADQSGRGAVCIDMDGDGDGAGSEPGEPYPLAQYDAGCPDSNDEILDHGYWVLPDDIEDLTGGHPDRNDSWDVMDDPGDSTIDYPANVVGPMSTLDSHDPISRANVPCNDPFCLRKTVVPDGELTVADAIMPPLKIAAQIADPADAGFLKEANKVGDLGLNNAYASIVVPAAPEIPPTVAVGGYDWDSWVCRLQHIRDAAACPPENLGLAQGPYDFFHATTVDDPTHPRYVQLYTDNRGQAFFFANGDYNLSFDDCAIQQLSGTPDCEPGDTVGVSDITVIGDYPYFRKHPAIASNPVEEAWTWGGFKSVTAEAIDATHTAIIAHLKDRDGYCAWDVDEDPTQTDGVIFSPSLNEVQHEWIEFLINTDVGEILDVSPNALYLGDVADQHSVIDIGMPLHELVQIRDHVHSPLAEERSTGLEPDMGRFSQAERAAVARAEDVRVLDFYGDGRAVDARYTDPEAFDECQAWVIIEHPADQTPNVSVIFHNPEGETPRHWPTATRVVNLVPGWNDVCYTGSAQSPGDVLGDAVDHVLAIWRFDSGDGSFERWFPGRPEISNMTTVNPYDQLIILMDAGASWMQEITVPPAGVELAQGWNSVCYAGADKAPDEATASIQGDFPVMYTVASDQGWRRYVPDYPWATNIVTLNQFTSVSMLVTAAGGAIWVFDEPGVPGSPSAAPPEVSAPPEADATALEIPGQVEMCAPVFPGTYLGTVTVQGAPAPDGTVVHASVGGIEWANAMTSGGLYVLDVPQVMPAVPPCFAGGEVAFEVDGLSCQESVAWNSGLHELNLTCGEAATKVRIGSDQASPGGQATVPLEALGVPAAGLSAFTVDIAYEVGVVVPTNYVGDPSGHFDNVLCNLNYGPSTVRCSGVRATPDAVGDLLLANITFEVEPGAALGHQSRLVLSVPTLADAQGHAIPHGTEDGSIRVGLIGNVDCDGDVDAVDALFILQYVVGLRSASDQCPLPSEALYLPGADAQCDNDVDAVDALFVLQHVVGLRPVLCSGP